MIYSQYDNNYNIEIIKTQIKISRIKTNLRLYKHQYENIINIY